MTEHSGFIWAPIIPKMAPTMFKPEDFKPRKGVMTRYGKKMLRADMYGIISLTSFGGPPTIHQMELPF